MKVLAITQARIGSKRLPNKILKKIQGKTLLEIHLSRILQAKKIDQIKIATTTEVDSQKIIDIAEKMGVGVYQGSLDNVLERFYMAARSEEADWIVRLTSDCPLIDPNEIDKVIDFTIANGLDYGSNTLHPTLPDGMDVEVFKFSALEKAYQEAGLKSELEHVTPYIRKNSSYHGNSLFRSGNIENDKDYSEYRITVDTEEDFEVIAKLIDLLGIEKSWQDYVNALDNHPKIKEINNKYSRNEGYTDSITNDQKMK